MHAYAAALRRDFSTVDIDWEFFESGVWGADGDYVGNDYGNGERSDGRSVAQGHGEDREPGEPV